MNLISFYRVKHIINDEITARFKSWMIESRAPSITLCLDNNTEAFADLTFMKRHSDSLNSARNSQFHLGVKPGDQEWENVRLQFSIFFNSFTSSVSLVKYSKLIT